MVTISLCMIVKNEEEVLQQCLSSVKGVCDELIIVDTGSTDATKEIAKKFTDKVFDFEWVDDFALARNYAFKHATKDYIMWIDADDLLLETDQEKLLTLKSEMPSNIDAVSMLYHLAFDEFDNPTFSSRRHRLVKRSNQFQWIGPVHEYLEVGGHIIQSDIAITHRKTKKSHHQNQSNRNIKIYEQRLAKGEAFSPRDLFYYANELKDHARYDESILYYCQFLETKKGWVEDEIRACLYLASCFRALGDKDKELESLVLSIKYDVPRPEASCQIGDIYKEKSLFRKAIFWYHIAIEHDSEDNFNFKDEIYSTWYPHLQLCYCYWQIGEKNQSLKHNSLAKTYRPNDSRVLQNEQFFEQYFHDK